jgi:endonuclease G
MIESFLMSNMSPQGPEFNRGSRRKLEEWVRDQAIANEEVYVVTGPVLTDGPYPEIGPNGVDVPKRYFKVLLDYKDPELKVFPFTPIYNVGENLLGHVAVCFVFLALACGFPLSTW